jgi:hypothetical protein
MGKYGIQLGWKRIGNFSHLPQVQEDIQKGFSFLATAHGGSKPGYVELLGKGKPRSDFFADHYIAKAIWRYIPHESPPDIS